MDIFKLGDKILALLEMVFGFWNNQVSLVFSLLGQSPVSFKGGGPWGLVESVQPIFVAVGSSLVVLFFVIGFCSESVDVREEMRFEVILRMLIRLGLSEWLVANNVTIMKAFFNTIGNLVNVLSAGSYTTLTIDSAQAQVIKDLGFGEGLIMLILAALLSVIVIICGFFMIYTVYFRFLKIMVIVPIGSIAFSTLAGNRNVANTASTYAKYFLSVVFEAVTMALAIMLCKQRESLNTALPIGVRQVETMRTMLTQSLAVLMPFNVQELNDKQGCYYGINQVSKNINIGNRKKLINGNGFVFGVPGSGKSFFCKMEMGNVFLSGNDEIIVIDPMNEYFDIAETYGGTVVNMSTYTDNYVNPLDMDVWSLDLNDSKGMIREKGEFMLGLCEQCMGESLNSRQKSIIDRCVRKLYIEIARSREKYVPIMSDFYEILMNQPEDEAKDIALSLELFVNGSLNIFNHQTNVDVDNRFTVYGIRDLGTELSPITMLVMMESIQNRIIANGKRGIATWLYIDEFHVLLNSEYSAKYLQQLWKKVRKQGGLCTGITQNIVDLLQNYTATTMLANSEFVALLKQANTDSSRMAEVIGVSEAQLRFVTNTSSGMGLMKCGNVVIPFDNTIEKGTDLYNLYNTNIHEKIQMQKMAEKGQKSS